MLILQTDVKTKHNQDFNFSLSVCLSLSLSLVMLELQGVVSQHSVFNINIAQRQTVQCGNKDSRVCMCVCARTRIM